jgi:uncharacterized protein (TIGR02466 family)
MNQQQKTPNIGRLPTLFQLFPVPVAMEDLGRSYTQKELDHVLNLPTHRNKGNKTSDNNRVLNEHPLKHIRKDIEEKLNRFFQELYKPSPDTRLVITQSWVNFTTQGGYHHLHSHPNSFVSGVLYIQADSESDVISFSRPGVEQFHVGSVTRSEFTSTEVHIPVRTGILTLFPSSLRHEVPPTSGEVERISLSFNTFFKGAIGNKNTLTCLTV